MSYKYKNVSDTEQHLMGHGTVAKGGEIVTETVVENPNFEYVGEADHQSNGVVGTVQAKPDAILEATLVEPQTNNEQQEQ